MLFYPLQSAYSHYFILQTQAHFESLVSQFGSYITLTCPIIFLRISLVFSTTQICRFIWYLPRPSMESKILQDVMFYFSEVWYLATEF
jgi:hypothetical protein